jgi:large subunit ribosomal protein L23
MRFSKLLKKPVITEKSFELSSRGVYEFSVDLKANKPAIAREVEKLYGVEVVDVRTIVLPGKKKRIMGTRNFTKSSKRKKALITLKKGQKLELFPKE